LKRPTNVISITDGQIYLESDLFFAGQRPAVNAGLSVSRVGGDAQTKIMKQVAGRLRMELAAYRELAAFALFASDLDAATKSQLERGQRLMELLKQPQYSPIPLVDQVISIFALTNGYADKVAVKDITPYLADLRLYARENHPELGQSVNAELKLTKEIETAMRGVIEGFNRSAGAGYQQTKEA
jgi:proton translocating ATP synthase F1 alpha subunit